jgi:Bromodomain
MDLSLIRKMIVARKIKSYADLHMHVGLISHNCVKYNGRETDYGVVARDFEAMADETILQTILEQQQVHPVKQLSASPAPGLSSDAEPSIPSEFVSATTSAPAIMARAPTFDPKLNKANS